MNGKNVFIALTGASGSIYGLRLMEEFCRKGFRVTAAVSTSGQLVCREETGLDLAGDLVRANAALADFLEVDEISLVAQDDLFCSAASGSAAPDFMIVAPCSMGTLARIACGISGNLIERTADVMLKEHRRLLLVPRETPLSEIHLENMLRLARAGARIIPAMPAFYSRPDCVKDMIDFVVGKVLDQAGIDNDLYRRWGN